MKQDFHTHFKSNVLKITAEEADAVDVQTPSLNE